MQFLYMARRDRTAVELLGVFENKEVSSNQSRISKLSSLNLSPENLFKLENFYTDKKMMWELIVENFTDFDDFRNNLKKRRYDNLPVHAGPKLFNEKKEVISVPNKKPKVMLQKKTDFDNN